VNLLQGKLVTAEKFTFHAPGSRHSGCELHMMLGINDNMIKVLNIGLNIFSLPVDEQPTLNKRTWTGSLLKSS